MQLLPLILNTFETVNIPHLQWSLVVKAVFTVEPVAGILLWPVSVTSSNNRRGAHWAGRSFHQSCQNTDHTWWAGDRRLIHHFQPQNCHCTVAGGKKWNKQKKKKNLTVIYSIDQTRLQLGQWTERSASMLGSVRSEESLCPMLMYGEGPQLRYMQCQRNTFRICEVFNK